MPEYAQAVVDGWSDGELLRLHLHELPRSLMGLDRERRIELLAERPPMTGTPWDALLAAMVEHVCELHNLEPPTWSQERQRFIDIPHFFTTRHDYIETVVYAPAAFVRHGALANARDLDARGGEKHVWIPGSRPDEVAPVPRTPILLGRRTRRHSDSRWSGCSSRVAPDAVGLGLQQSAQRTDELVESAARTPRRRQPGRHHSVQAAGAAAAVASPLPHGRGAGAVDAGIQDCCTLDSPWWNPASHRERRGARVARRDEEAYWAYSTEEQRSPGGMHRRSNAAGLSPRAVQTDAPDRDAPVAQVDRASVF